MARIPTIISDRPLDTAAGTVPNTSISGAVGRALSGAGSELAAIGARITAREQQQEDFLAQQHFLQMQTDFQGDLEGLQRDMDPTGKGFHDNAMTFFDARAHQFLSGLSPRLQQEYSEKIKTVAGATSNRMAKLELGQWDVYQTEETGKMLDKLATGINTYGSGSMDAYIAQGEGIINATNLPAIKKQELIENWREMAKTTALQTMTPEERKRALGDALDIDIPKATGSVVDKIVGAESGGSNTAKNPNSSATGAGQFIDSTWINMIRKYRPDLADGRSRSQILALRSDGSLSREMVGRYAQENAAQIQAAGFRPTAGNIYLAHFLGPQGAIDMLKADPNADAASVNPGAAKSNEAIFYRHGAPKSVAQLIAWADRKMGGTRSAMDARRPIQAGDPRFADVPLDTRLKLIGQADNEISAADRAATAQLKAQQAQEKDSFSLRIATGDTSLTPQDILGSGLDDGDKAALINSYNAKNKEMIATNEALNLFADRKLSVDPFSTDGQKTVDNVYDAALKYVKPDQMRALQEELVTQTGVVPSGALNRMRAGLQSTNISDVTSALQDAERISTINAAAFSRRSGGGELQDAADDFKHYVNDLNLSPEQAARRIMDARDPAKQRERKAIEPAAKEFIKGLQDFDIAGQFDESFLGIGGNPTLGITPSQELGIRADFLAIAEDQFYRANGDPDLAKARAVEEMKRLYGVTDFNGVKAVVKHPPEMYWPKSTYESGDGARETVLPLTPELGGQPTTSPVSSAEPSLDYARKQLFADVKALHPDADLSTVRLVTTPGTDAMIKRGELPGYAILYKDRNGMYQTIPGKLWRPDISKALAVNKAEQSLDEAERVRKARVQQGIQRDIVDEQNRIRSQQSRARALSGAQ